MSETTPTPRTDELLSIWGDTDRAQHWRREFAADPAKWERRIDDHHKRHGLLPDGDALKQMRREMSA